MKRVLVTGPVDHLEEYSQAAREAGWEPIDLPLLAIDPLPLARSTFPEGRYDWICVTSASCLPYLAEVLARRPALRDVPCAVVGERTAERVSGLGLRNGLEPAPDRGALASALLARAGSGASVLWPRGPLSDDLARALRSGGLEVDAPIAYSARALERGDPPPSEAVFFASPSAVHAWLPRGEEPENRVAIAIGRTTFEALMLETAAGFSDTISLPNPTPEAFGFVLAHLDPKMSP